MGLPVSWHLSSATSIGTSHLKSGLPCQDACLVDLLPMMLGEPALMAFVADGAGSATHAALAAQTAVSQAASFSRRHAETIGAHFDVAFVGDLVRQTRTLLERDATTAGVPVREFACTLLGVLAFRDRTLAFQIGDGAIVLDHGQGLTLAITPMSGEYVNMTHFLIDDDAEARVAVLELPAVQKLALCSDGLQRLVLNLGTNAPHAPFFEPFFATLAKTPPARRADLDVALARFLDSDKVNARTDDDKALVLALIQS